MIPNFIIPSEYEMLGVLERGSGIAVVWDINAKQFIAEKRIQLLWNSNQMPSTEVFLLSGKNDNFNTAFQEIESVLKGVLS